MKITATENGPLKVVGARRASRTPRTTTAQPIDLGGKDSVFLCRCGGSTNKPFCDGTHSKSGSRPAERAVGGRRRLAPDARRRGTGQRQQAGSSGDDQRGRERDMVVRRRRAWPGRARRRSPAVTPPRTAEVGHDERPRSTGRQHAEGGEQQPLARAGAPCRTPAGAPPEDSRTLAAVGVAEVPLALDEMGHRRRRHINAVTARLPRQASGLFLSRRRARRASPSSSRRPGSPRRRRCRRSRRTALRRARAAPRRGRS